jgi:MinD-like ATPase involved in chromosome partitioning or flagellar assembly
MTGSQFLDILRKHTGDFNTYYTFRFPTVYIQIESELFNGRDEETREDDFSLLINVPIQDIRKIEHNCLFTLQFLTKSEIKSSNQNNKGYSWLQAFVQVEQRLVINVDENETLRFFHFYGYKGGQGRSTMLCAFARYLAKKGKKILILDCDFEAPSLDLIFGKEISDYSKTLLGIVHEPARISSTNVEATGNGGIIDLIACRPNSDDYDVDFAAFSLQISLFPDILKPALLSIKRWSEEQNYDYVFVDHRSGMAVPTLSLMEIVPGQLLIFLKLDNQWLHAKKIISTVMKQSYYFPAIVISFRSAPESEKFFRDRTEDQQLMIERMLQDSLPEQDISESPDDIVNERFLVWPYDDHFRDVLLPEIENASSDITTVLYEVSRLSGINILPRQSPSGALDEGLLLQTDALNRLRTRNNDIRYIFGRKGTGKTRLVTELQKEGYGEILIKDSTISDTATSVRVKQYGLKSSSIAFNNLRDKNQKSPEKFWWTIIVSGLNTKNCIKDDIEKQIARIEDEGKNVAELRSEILNTAKKLENPRIFMLDGLETAFGTTEQTIQFMSSLFNMLLTIQSDEVLNRKIIIKLFLRQDLASKIVIQNREQLIRRNENELDLMWNYQSILNYLLSRLVVQKFMKNYFKETCKEIQEKNEKIQHCSLLIPEAETILQSVFPQRIARFNTITTSFLRLQFTDQAKSINEEASYYPRLMDYFVEELGKQSIKTDFINESKKINQRYLVLAQEESSKQYLDQVKQEMKYLLNFGSADVSDNKLQEWFRAFSDQITPFNKEDLVTHLTAKTKLTDQIVRENLTKMFDFGIFEEDDNICRVGRLFKASLGMKYHRQ